MGRLLLALAVVTASGCSRELWGVPRVPLSAISPDGRWVALVRNHPTIDGPEQSIWLGPADGTARQLRRLAPDAEWTTAIVWSADSRRVGFVTMDAVIDVYDSSGPTRVASGYVRRPNTGYPPVLALRDPSFSADGRELTFVPCERNYGVTNDRPDRLRCEERRDVLRIDELADWQARFHPGRAF